MFSSLTQALGVDGTFFVQFLIFLLFYPILSRWLFRPYFQLQNQRERETLNRVQQAEKWEKKKQSLEQEYEAKAKSLNKQFNSLYSEASQHLEEDFLAQRKKDQAVLKKEHALKKKYLFQEIKTVEESLQSETDQLAKATLDRLLS